MEIKQFHLENFGRFASLEVLLAPTENVNSNVTVLVGNNGAGKTSILMALAISLSWFVARLRTEKGSGSLIPVENIFNGAAFASVNIEVIDQQKCLPNLDTQEYVNLDKHLYNWTVTKTNRGKKGQQSKLNDASRLAGYYRNALTQNEQCNLPLIAFYPVERMVLDIPLRIRKKHSFEQLDGYDNSLNQGVDFRRFFEWFREREDSENESSIPQEVLDKILETISNENDLWHQLKHSYRDRQLTAVRSAITTLIPEFSNLKVSRKPRLHMSVDKDGETFNVLQLSQGEKSLMALVGDIARRLAMMNPSLENPLHGDGIVLIDEVDMHLHPTWQRSLIERLTSTFPNCQFLLTTHSPLVISDCKDVLVYSLDNGRLFPVPSQYGQDANTVLLDVMNTHIRNAYIYEKLNDLLGFIQSNDLDKARQLFAELADELPPNNLELSKAKLLLQKQELRSEKD